MKEEEIVEESPQEKSKKEAYLEYAKSRFGESFNPEDEESMYGTLHEYMRNNDESQNRFAEALTQDPRLAQVMADIIGKKRGSGAALARYFGKDFLSTEEGSPEYEELVKAEEERMADLERSRASQKEFDANIEKSLPVLDEFARENGMENCDAFLDEVYAKILEPIFSGNYTKEVLQMLYKALNYDTDVNEAFTAGNVKGKNERIEAMKKDIGDGLPKIGGGGKMPENKPKPKKAFNVRTGSVWDD